MHIWHDTVDAPRRPGRVSPGEVAEITVGTWPIEPGQSVQVLWEMLTGARSRTGGTIAARWQRNDAGNSYWTAQLGPFGDGDRVTYSAAGASAEGAVQGSAAIFRVKPAHAGRSANQRPRVLATPTTRTPPTSTGSCSTSSRRCSMTTTVDGHG